MAKILLVDDEELVRRVVRVVLEAEGHSVTEAEDGRSALESMDADPADAVVLDLLIPGMDGYEICRKIKSSRPESKVLVLTSVPREEADPEAMGSGADEVMTKPFSALDLLARLRALLEA